MSASEPTVIFAVAGDIASQNRWRALIDSLNQSDAQFFVALGDLSYAANEQSWCDTWLTGSGNPSGRSFKNIRLATGNHDTGEVSGGNIDLYTQYCGSGGLTSFVSAPRKTTNNNQTRGCTWPDDTRKCYAKEYYFDVPVIDPIIRFIVATPKVQWAIPGLDSAKEWRFDNCNERNTHCGWVREAIDNATSTGIRWVIVAVHKTWIEISENHQGEIPQEFFRMLVERNVIILHAHTHNYQRSKQLAISPETCPTVKTTEFNPGCVVASGSQFVKNAGSIVSIVGTGGYFPLSPLNTTESDAPYFQTYDNSTYGYLKISVSKMQLSGTFVKTVGTGTYTDAFTVTDVPSPPIPDEEEEPPAIPDSRDEQGASSIFGLSPLQLYGTTGLVLAALTTTAALIISSRNRKLPNSS